MNISIPVSIKSLWTIFHDWLSTSNSRSSRGIMERLQSGEAVAASIKLDLTMSLMTTLGRWRDLVAAFLFWWCLNNLKMKDLNPRCRTLDEARSLVGELLGLLPGTLDEARSRVVELLPGVGDRAELPRPGSIYSVLDDLDATIVDESVFTRLCRLKHENDDGKQLASMMLSLMGKTCRCTLVDVWLEFFLNWVSNTQYFSKWLIRYPSIGQFEKHNLWSTAHSFPVHFPKLKFHIRRYLQKSHITVYQS